MCMFFFISDEVFQMVPSIIKRKEVSDNCSERESDDQVLHEMQALQDEIGEMHNQLMML